MATRKRKTTRKAPARKPAAPREPLISPETARSITGVILAVVGVILLLAIVGIGGPLGHAILQWIDALIGWSGVLLAGLLLFLSYVFLYSVGAAPPVSNKVFGGTLVIVGCSALLHLFSVANVLDTAQLTIHGGLVGYALSASSVYAIGRVGSTILWLAVIAVGFLIIFNRPLRRQKSAEEAPVPAPVPPHVPVAPVTPPPKPASPKEQPDFQPRVVDTAWEQPPLSLLSSASASAMAGDTKRSAALIEQTLRNFGIVTTVENLSVGPAVTQYELRPDAGVKVNQINALSNDLALALAAHPIRIEAPIPGKSTVGIEVPNQKPAVVRLRQLFESDAWKRAGVLPMALGADVAGQAVVADLAAMPHLLIAGATGAGKSVGINSILMSLLYTHSPKHLRLLLVDPKRVELTLYNDIPHLVAPVIVEAPKVVNALKWVVSEMDRRYKLFQERRVKNLGEFNAQFGRKSGQADETLPYLVVVIDELADLMQVSGKAVEATIVRIAQLARATGIHLILATQRPSVDVITGLIKANFPSRLAFTVTSATDSRTILDSGGAEKLLGRGDMLFMPGNVAKPIRVQGAFVENSEVKKLTEFLKGKGAPSYEENVTEKQSSGGLGGGDDESDDPLYDEAKAEVVRARKASASFLQRRLKVGYARAARLIDMMEENGVVGPGEGAKPRDILVEAEDL